MLQLKASATAFAALSRQVTPLTKSLLAHVGGSSPNVAATASSTNNAASSLLTSLANRASAHAGAGGSSSSGGGAGSADGTKFFQNKFGYSAYNTAAQNGQTTNGEDEDGREKYRLGFRRWDEDAKRQIRERFVSTEAIRPTHVRQYSTTSPTSDSHASDSLSSSDTSIDHADHELTKISYLEQRGDVDGAKQEFRRIRSSGVQLSAESYRSLIHVLSRATTGPNPLSDMLAAYNAMVEIHAVPDTQTYSTLIKALCQRDQTVTEHKQGLLKRKEAIETSHNSSELHANVANDLHSQYVQLENEMNFENAMSLFQASSRDFDISVYNALLASCAMHGRTQEALMIFDALDSASPAADADSFSNLIATYAAANDVNGAIDSFNEYAGLQQKGSPIAVQNALIDAFFHVGDAAAAITVFEKMLINNNVRFDSETVDTIISGFCSMNETQAAVEWLDKIATTKGLPTPTAKTYSRLLAHLCEQKKFGQATHTLNLLLNNRTHEVPDYYDLQAYLALAVELGRPEYTVQLAIAMQRQYGMNVDLEGAYKLIQSMLSRDQLSPALSLYIVALQGWQTTKVLDSMHSELLVSVATDLISHSQATYVDTFLPLLPHLRSLHGKVPGDMIINLYMKDRYTTKQRLQSLEESPISIASLDVIYQELLANQLQTPTSDLSIEQRKDRYETLSALISDMTIDMALGLPESLASDAALYIQALDLPFELDLFLEDMQTRFGYMPPSEIVRPPVPLIAEAYPPFVPQEPVPPRLDSRIQPEIHEEFSQLANNALQRGMTNNALTQLDNIERAGMWMSPEIAVPMLSVLSKTKDNLTAVERLYQHVEMCVPHIENQNVRVQHWISALNSMIVAHGTNGNMDLGREYMMLLSDLGRAPSADAMASFVIGLGSSSGNIASTDHGAVTDEATEALKIYQEAKDLGVQFTVFLFNTILSKLSKARRTDQALELFEEMKGMGLQPNSITFGTMINACCRVGDEISAQRFFAEMEADTSFAPRVPPYNTLMQYFTTTRADRKSALQYYDAMRRKGLKPTSHTYKLLIDAHALEAEHLGEAASVLRTIRQDGEQVTTAHYAALVHAYGCVQRNVALAVQTFEAIYKEPVMAPKRSKGRHTPTASRLTPDDVAYQALLETFVANHRMDEARTYIDRMVREGVALTPYIANLFIRGYAQAGDLESASRVFYNDMLDVDEAAYARRSNRNAKTKPIREPSTYEAMVRAYLAFGLRAQAEEVVRRMQTKGFPFAVLARVRGILEGGDGFAYPSAGR